jgi:uncharacterized membrane protein
VCSQPLLKQHPGLVTLSTAQMSERPRKRLTPMSGELRAEADWAKVEDTPRERAKKEKSAPRTRTGMIVAGLLRAFLILVMLVALTALVAALIVWLSDADAARVFTVTFILAGALLAIGGFLGATSGPAVNWVPEPGFGQGAKERAVNMSFVYGAFGLALVGIGILLDALL